ncbi:serine/threonine-protein kinase [Bifidobacterium sp. ESL0728]|uniref:serine/threonine-protein kinase n=1 Tax=Bifidobacterium sp. ESL0728 TaxID=2983220 RepID=UPI0023F7298E|nr:serine/threonine-protein kinase [Bifidobacterium sp. ESL0728]WEV58863.1 serine/threonine-protein kinase [Bifidobacterium sp. ESL0728]
MTSTEMTLKEFKALFDSFDEVPFTRGGQKEVYGAIHPKYGNVVVKVVFQSDARSKREIQILQQHHFVNVPKLYDVATLNIEGKDTTVLVEQRIAGKTLFEIIQSGKRYNLNEATDFLEQSLHFIDEIAAQGIVHRDIKPANIMLIPSGTYYFLDFGIARLASSASITPESRTSPLTPGYCAPEQFMGGPHHTDTRADLFSIAVVTYELVSGKNPFRSDDDNDFSVLMNTATLTPTDFRIPGDTQSQFMGLLSSMMSKSVIQRPRNAQEALDWLHSAETTFGK